MKFTLFDTTLASAVERFARTTQDASDADLEQAWAWREYDAEGVRFAFFRTYEELRELAAKIAAERAASGPAPSTAHRILAQYHTAYRDLEAALLGVGSDQADLAPAEGEWSVREAVGHIARADVRFYVVTKYAWERHRTGDGRPADPPDEAVDEILGEELDAVDAILDGSLAEIRTYHAPFHDRILRELAGITDDVLPLPSTYWESGPLSIRFRLHRFDSHLRQHTIQVDKTLVDIGQPPSEAKRLLRLIFNALAEVEGAMIGAWDVGQELRATVAESITARAEEIAGILAPSP